MPTTLSTHIEIPSTIAGKIHLTHIPAAPLKLLLIAESERPRGSDLADMPVARVRAMAGWTKKTLYESVQRLAALRTRETATSDRDDDEAWAIRKFDPFAADPVMEYDGDDERVRIRFSERWLIAARGPGIVLPLDELRAFRQRSAVLLRLRVGDMLLRQHKARRIFTVSDLSMLSGCGDAVEPAAQIRPAIRDGLKDFAEHCSNIIVSPNEAVTRTGFTKSLTLTATRLEERDPASTRGKPGVSKLDDIHVSEQRM